MIGGSGGAGCEGGIGATEEIDGAMVVVMTSVAGATAVVGGTGETSVRRAMLSTFVSLGGSGFGGGFRP
jgi:hypothetical protein